MRMELYAPEVRYTCNNGPQYRAPRAAGFIYTQERHHGDCNQIEIR